jgi:hypothetical protein
MLNWLTLLVAIALSAVAAFYSILGLVALFPGNPFAIVMMGAVLEAAKVIGATWLHRNWNIISRFTRTYLTSGCIVLMMITSIGIFGFLSQSHIESSLKTTGTEFSSLKSIQSDITDKKTSVDDYSIQIKQIDDAISKLKGPQAVEEIAKQRKIRTSLVATRSAEQKLLSELETKKTQVESQTKRIEAEIGPLKYAANLWYGSADNDQLEKAVRFMILMIIFAFDPMALCLIMAVSGNLENSNRIKSSGFLQKAELSKLRGRPIGVKNKPKDDPKKRFQIVNKDSISSLDPFKEPE